VVGGRGFGFRFAIGCACLTAVMSAAGVTSVDAFVAPPRASYVLVGADGGVFTFGPQHFRGSLAATPPRTPIVSIIASETGSGYRLVDAEGRIVVIGAVPNYGDLSSVRLNAPIVGAVGSHAGNQTVNGYVLFGRDGGVFTFGHARFYGSLAGHALSHPIVGGALDRAPVGPDPNVVGHGYWLVDNAGRVYSFGDAPFLGDLRAVHLWSPIVGIAEQTHDEGKEGYLLVAADGSVYAFGNALYEGDMGSTRLAAPIVGIAADTEFGSDYYLVAADGGVFTFPRPAPGEFLGSMGAHHLAAPVTAIDFERVPFPSSCPPNVGC
jgi:hypothetical protein